MDETELRKLQVEAWKTIVEVQRHFNDIEMKIRALAITVLTAVLGAAAVAVRDGTTLHVAHTGINLGMAILIIGILVWMLFYFVDQIWYHRLLLGAVLQGQKLEDIFAESGIAGFDLTNAIKVASPYTVHVPLRKLKLFSFELHSTGKIRVFYYVVAALLVAAAITLATSHVAPATNHQSSTRSMHAKSLRS